MKKLLILATAILFLIACGEENLIDTEGSTDVFKEKPQATVDKTKISGLWESSPVYDGTMNQKIRIRFNENQEKVVLGSECKYNDGTTLYAQVEVPADFRDNGAEVIAADQDYQTKQNGSIKYECFANLTRMFFKIGLNGKINIDGFLLSKIAD